MLAMPGEVSRVRPQRAVGGQAQTAAVVVADRPLVRTLFRKRIMGDFVLAQYRHPDQMIQRISFRSYDLAMNPRIPAAKSPITPKAFHIKAQGRDSAPWVALRMPRSARICDPAETADRRSPEILETFGRASGSVREPSQRCG